MKATISIGYRTYVMDAEKAITLLEMLSDAEVYESKWDGKTTAYYVYPQDNNDHIRELRILPDALYRMAKLAGKPVKDNT